MGNITPTDQIVEGDQVSIYWENVQNVFSAEVLHVASGPGEVWIVREHNGTVHYIMSFARMTREKKVKPDEHEQEQKSTDGGTPRRYDVPFVHGQSPPRDSRR